MTRWILTILFFISTMSHASCQTIQIGPESYHVKRTRSGGSHQEGWLWGGHITYERAAPWALYWAADGYYVTGSLDGKNSVKVNTRSDVDEWEIEGRIGYTLQWCLMPQLSLFVGGGYFHETNHFRHPKEMAIKLTEHFSYASTGLQLKHEINPCSSIGLLLSAKWMVEGKSKISEDPEFDDITLSMGEELQYTIDVPYHYTTCLLNKETQLALIPFYRYRHFGGHPNYPFDFVETKFHIWGARATMSVQW